MRLRKCGGSTSPLSIQPYGLFTLDWRALAVLVADFCPTCGRVGTCATGCIEVEGEAELVWDPHAVCCDDCKAALELIRESGFVFTDPRLKYAEIQVDREEYDQLMTKLHGASPYD
jgi:hypothetical protein